MADTLQQFSLPDAAGLVINFLVYVVAGLVPACAATYLIYFMTTIPMRRNQRARSFLNLVELGLQSGRTPEAIIVDASSSRDRSLGARFHLLAAYLEGGMRLTPALEKVPRFLPPQIVSTLKVGERIGDIGKVLPACRHLMRDAVSQVRGAINYLVLLAFVLTPFSLGVPIVLRTKVLPQFKQIFAGMLEGAPLPAFSRFVFGGSGLFTQIQVAVVAFLWLAMLAYVGGPRLGLWVNRVLPGFPDVVTSRLPWRRKRLQRDFSAMLAVLLDSGVPEREAVNLAAGATANSTMVHRAEKVTALLREGTALPDAIHAMDDCGEFRWRLRNALQHGGGFLRALDGWHAALDAKAFQLEQTSAQLITTSLVLVNGVVVGCITIAIFLALVHLING